MQKFHTANPGLRWDARSIPNSMRGAAKRNATADHGVNMDPGLRQEYSQMTGGSQP
jgi:hypothetical protein